MEEFKAMEALFIRLSGMQKAKPNACSQVEFQEVAGAVVEILSRKREGYGDFNDNHQDMEDRQALYSLHNDIQRKVVRLGNLIGLKLDKPLRADEMDALLETILDIAGYGILGLLLAIERSDYK